MQSSLCAICICLLEKNDDIQSTICGHVFHMPCLQQWLERSKNCPQCREKLTKDKIHRLFFNFNNNESIREDADTLQMRVDNMQFQLDLKEAEIKKNTEKCKELDEQTKKLRKAVTSRENQLREKESAISALKEQAKYLKNVADEKNVIAAQFQSLKSRIDEYQAIRKLLAGSSAAAEEVVEHTQDPQKLGVYVRALKRQLQVEVDRRRELRDLVKTVKENMQLVVKEKREIEAAKTELEMDNDALEKANKELRQKIYGTPATGENNTPEVEELIEVQPIKRKKFNLPAVKVLLESASEDEENAMVQIPRYKITSAKDDYKNSRAKDLPVNSILRKRPRIASNPTTRVVKRDDMVPDGMGGYEKIDVFPTTRKTKSDSPTKPSLKRKITDTKNHKMDSFIDLT